jgi:putative acetyltransferase
MNVRSEKAHDTTQITAIHDQAFKGPDEGKIVEALRKNNNLTISLVCEIDGRLAGHIAYSPIIDENNETIGIGLAPVAVLPSMHKQGIGSRLIEHGNRKAIAMGFNKIFVLGEPSYYSRFGFVLAREYNYYCDFDPTGEHFMVLGAQEREPERTMVYYCREFNE